MYIKLRQIREERKLSQVKMGQLLSISQPQYQRKEMGIVPFSTEERMILAQYLDKKMEELFDKEEISQNNHRQQGGVAAMYYVVEKLVDVEEKRVAHLKEELEAQKKENKRLRTELERLKKT